MRIAVTAAAICLSIVGLSVAEDAGAAMKKQFTNISAQGLGPALQTLAQQREFQVVYLSDNVDSLRTVGAVGEMTSDEALTQLLSGTGLTFRHLDDRTVTVFPIASTFASSKPLMPVTGGSVQHPDERVSGGGSSKNLWSGFRLAQNIQSTQGTDASSTSEVQKTDQSRDIGIDEQVDLGEIVVIGTNIRGVYPSSSPVEIFTAEDIARTGATTTEQFFERLPANLGARSQNAPGATSAANQEGVSAVDLRGLGVGTTLVLVNGRRIAPAGSGAAQAVDISMVPVSAIARVEVLTDGASAIYGSDAIGGVVNLVLRDDLDGAETTLSYGGVTDGGLRQGGFTHSMGASWQGGHALVGYNYLSASELRYGERSYASAAGVGSLVPITQRQGLLAAVSQDVSDTVTLSGDFLFSQRDNKSVNTLLTALQTARSSTDQYFVTTALDWDIAENWHATASATYSENDTEMTLSNVSLTGDPPSAFILDSYSSVYDLNAMLDGALFEAPGGAVRFSLGAGFISETFMRPGRPNLERETRYYFGELLVPLVSEAQGVPVVRRLELSLAGRGTEYEDRTDPALGIDFGSRTSPKVGLLWSPAEGLNLRTTYGESFRAAPLAQIDPAGAFNAVTPPGLFGTPDIWSPTGETIMLAAAGGANSTLAPETAETFTIGFDWRPAGVSGLSLSATYFRIDYEDRIALADPTSEALFNPSAFPEVFVVSPSVDFVAQILASSINFLNTTSIDLTDPVAAAQQLTALPSFVVYNNRIRNLALSELDGFDVGVAYSFETSDVEFTVGANASYIASYREQLTQSADIVSAVDTVLRPVDLRGNIYAGLSRGGFDTRLTANYVDDYKNPFVSGGGGEVDSWLTFDWNAAYEFAAQSGPLEGVRLSLSVQNLLDEDPPFVALSSVASQGINTAVGFDPANASPLGRFALIEMSKRW